MSRLNRILSILVCFLSCNLYAAGPITHVVLAEKYLAKLPNQPSDEDKRLFMLGTIFPDIRYLGALKRSQSHFKGMTLQKVQETPSAFLQGMYFHSFVDENRDKYIRRLKIGKKLPEIPEHLQDTFLKAIEDQILQSQYNLASMRGYLATIPEEEKQYGIELQTLTQWHAGLTVYFTTQPSFILTQISLFDQGILSLDPQTVKLWSELIPKYAQDPVMQEYVAVMINNFDKSFTTS